MAPWSPPSSSLSEERGAPGDPPPHASCAGGGERDGFVGPPPDEEDRDGQIIREGGGVVCSRSGSGSGNVMMKERPMDNRHLITTYGYVVELDTFEYNPVSNSLPNKLRPILNITRKWSGWRLHLPRKAPPPAQVCTTGRMQLQPAPRTAKSARLASVDVASSNGCRKNVMFSPLSVIHLAFRAWCLVPERPPPTRPGPQ